MEFSNARWMTPDRTQVSLQIDGAEAVVPASQENRFYRALVEAGVPIQAYQSGAPTADEVRAEASSRMQAMVGARDAAHLEIIVANGNREAIRLQDKRLEFLAGEGEKLTDEEHARAEQLRAFDRAIEEIRAASNRLEPDPPLDFADDRYWQAGVAGS